MATKIDAPSSSAHASSRNGKLSPFHKITKKSGSDALCGSDSTSGITQSEHFVNPARYSALQKGQNMRGVYYGEKNKGIHSGGDDSRISRIISRARASSWGSTKSFGLFSSPSQRV